MFHESSLVSTMDDVKLLARNAGFTRLTPLQESVIPGVLEGKNLFINTRNFRGKTLAVVLSVLSRLPRESKGIKALIITPETKDILKAGALVSNIISSNRLPFVAAVLNPEGDPRKEIQDLSRNPDLIIGNTRGIIDQIRKNNLPLENTGLAAVLITREEIPEGFDKDLFFIFSKLRKKTQTTFFAPRDDYFQILEEISRKPQQVAAPAPQEEKEIPMPVQSKNPQTNEDFVKDKLKDLLELIRKDRNPKEIDRYKKLIKKHVPLTLRAYVGAYLLRALMDDAPGRPAAAPRKEESETDENSTTLFFSIGKNRRVFPKDLARYVTTTLSIDPSELGNIKVLDSYSFIDISTSHADKAVNMLNGQEFRGRKLTVNYARKK